MDLSFTSLRELVLEGMGMGPWIILGLCIAVVFERLRPARRYPDYWSRLIWFDLGAFAIMVAWSKVSNPGMEWLTAHTQGWHLPFWKDHLPWPVKAILVALLADCSNYWIHRAMHSYGTAGKVLWRTHIWHHETTALTALAGFRGSFLHRFLFASSYIVAGIIFDLREPQAILAIVIFNMVHDIVAHMNHDLWMGPFGLFLASPRWHRIHHINDPKLGNSNFGQHFTFWDRLFGTYTDPTTVPADAPLGLDGEPKNRASVIIGV